MRTRMYNRIGDKSIDEIAADTLLKTVMDFTHSSTAGPVPLEDRYRLVIDHFKERYDNGKDPAGKKYHQAIIDGITNRIVLIGGRLTEARALARTLDAFFSNCKMPGDKK